VGVIVMLICAGLLEGFARQLIDNTAGRFAVGGSMLLLWLIYFVGFGRERRRPGA
ncbi:MAG: stage II sporulation protein M, partial [Parasphingorhabdus sp.]